MPPDQTKANPTFSVTALKATSMKIMREFLRPLSKKGDDGIFSPSTEPRNGGFIIARRNEDKDDDTMFNVFNDYRDDFSGSIRQPRR